ncbi:MAG: hypothetical protein ACI8ZM_004584 [Crocinitomix sp.]|jgi:hypothetical protein
MKNITKIYITTLAVSIFLPFILIEDFVLAEKELFMYYYITVAVYLLTIISAFIKEDKIRKISLTIFSFFIILSAGLHTLLSAVVLVIGVARYLDHSNLFFRVYCDFSISTLYHGRKAHSF